MLVAFIQGIARSRPPAPPCDTRPRAWRRTTTPFPLLYLLPSSSSGFFPYLLFFLSHRSVIPHPPDRRSLPASAPPPLATAAHPISSSPRLLPRSAPSCTATRLPLLLSSIRSPAGCGYGTPWWCCEDDGASPTRRLPLLQRSVLAAMKLLVAAMERRGCYLRGDVVLPWWQGFAASGKWQTAAGLATRLRSALLPKAGRPCYNQRPALLQ
jgi:hypothetical protein